MDYLIGEVYGQPWACGARGSEAGGVLTLHLAQFLEIFDGLGQVAGAAEALGGLLVVAGQGVVHAEVVELFGRSGELCEEIGVVSVVTCGQIAGNGVEAAHGRIGEEALGGVEHAATLGAALGEAVAHLVEFGQAEEARIGSVALDGFGGVEAAHRIGELVFGAAELREDVVEEETIGVAAVEFAHAVLTRVIIACLSVDDFEELCAPLVVVGGEPLAESGPVFAVSFDVEEAGGEAVGLFEVFDERFGTAVGEADVVGFLSFGRGVAVDIHGAHRHVFVAEDGVGHAVDAGEFNGVVAQIAEEFGAIDTEIEAGDELLGAHLDGFGLGGEVGDGEGGAIGFAREAFGHGELVAFEFAGGAAGDLFLDVEFGAAGPLEGGCGDADGHDHAFAASAEGLGRGAIAALPHDVACAAGHGDGGKLIDLRAVLRDESGAKVELCVGAEVDAVENDVEGDADAVASGFDLGGGEPDVSPNVSCGVGRERQRGGEQCDD